MLEFRLLGPLEVVADDGPVALGGHRQRALLALLLLNANRVVSTDHLVGSLWGDEPPRTATSSLQNSISQLRKLLGAERVLTQPPGYVIRVEPDALDLSSFERLVGEARGRSAAERAETIRRALSLWRGEPLADFAFEAFAAAEARRLEELYLGALEERIEADLELGRHAELVGELEGLVRSNPLRERLRGQQMLALYRCDRQAEALDAFHDARRVLVEELGIEPSAALQQLHSAILRHERTLQPLSATTRPADHYGDVLKALLAARLVPVIGPTVALCSRPSEHVWDAGNGGFAPVDDDVAAHLAELFECPPELAVELARVSQYVALTKGVGPLYDELHALFDRDYEPGPVHELLASLPPLLRARRLPHQLIVSAAYDETLERAFVHAGEELDVVMYIASGPDRGRFLHVGPDGSSTVVLEPNAYGELSLESRTVLLKIHGQVDRSPERERESFVVSEDDYIDYLAGTDVANVIPVTLAAKLRRSHFLFLGYPVAGWNLRVFLRRVWSEGRVAYRSWAVHAEPSVVVREFWGQRGVDVFDVQLAEYVDELGRRVQAEFHDGVSR
jgi:DNA-binding SARP family transcriptional activator